MIMCLVSTILKFRISDHFSLLKSNANTYALCSKWVDFFIVLLHNSGSEGFFLSYFDDFLTVRVTLRLLYSRLLSCQRRRVLYTYRPCRPKFSLMNFAFRSTFFYFIQDRIVLCTPSDPTKFHNHEPYSLVSVLLY